ncbi:MAG: caspase family protein [Pyrinomonadaceae bacterium]|nr:caspase family protein [Pyrinomonadaceae bacterium]
MNPKRDELTGAIDSFVDEYGYAYGNRLLIYFAGHGHTAKAGDGRDLGYIIPSDAPLPDKDALNFQRKAVSMDTIQFYARKIQAKHALFVFDSCFSGKLVSRGNVAVPPFIVAQVGLSVRSN